MRAEASRRVSGVKHFAEQNLDAGRIHSARTDGEKRGPKPPAAVWAAEQNAAKAAIEKLRAGE
ncbi:hypothetical protein HMPREF0239_03722 [Clostridium sp. ATCC BAA-442]|nr:hypothetical protein HMPREF0239_03722 [Clostridium sp. ATCC BAA-442]